MLSKQQQMIPANTKPVAMCKGALPAMDKKKILVIDDEILFADTCKKVLTARHYEVCCAHSGEKGVELALHQTFQLVLVSSNQAGADCLATLDMLKQIEPGIVAILVVAKPELKMVIEGVNLGYSWILEKPVQQRQLIAAVEEALAVARIREENTRLKTLLPLYKLAQAFLNTPTEQQVFAKLIQAIREELRVPRVSVMVPDPATGTLQIVAAHGLAEDIVKRTRVLPGETIAGYVYEKGKPVILNRTTQAHTEVATLLRQKDLAAAISYPLKVQNSVVGVLNISEHDRRIEYSKADIELLSIICNQAEAALENVYAQKEREKGVRLRTMFEQYVDHEIAELLLSQNKNLLEVGEVRTLVVMFADIRNFTALVQHLEPDELRLFLNHFFEMFSNVVFAHKGTLDKFMGDAALVIFGAPVPMAAPADAAVLAARHIVKGFNILRQEWQGRSRWFNTIGLGIGISMGEVFLGNIGSERRLDYTVIGTDVNIAQRLASETESGKIFVTERLKAALSGSISLQEEKPRLLRGLDAPIPLYSADPDGC